MVYVEMIKNVAEGGVEFTEVELADGTKRPSRGLDGRPMRLKFEKGQVVSMHEEGAKKYVDRGLGRLTDPPEPEAA